LRASVGSTPWKGAEWSCIRRDLDGREELFRLSEDPSEQRNLAEDSGVQDVLRQLCTALERLTLSPLLPCRFQPGTPERSAVGRRARFRARFAVIAFE
jgi:hypothetical protein